MTTQNLKSTTYQAPLTPKQPSLKVFEGKPTHAAPRQDLEAPAGSEINFEWKPTEPGEQLFGMILQMNTMKLGGTALVLQLADQHWTLQTHKDQTPVTVLHKCGGWTDNRIERFAPPLLAGHCVMMEYHGDEPPSQAGHSPMRKVEIYRRKG